MLKKQKQRRSLLELVNTAIIGYADGSTVPFALTSGMTALGNREAVIAAGLLEIVAGSLSMAGGAWLAASTERSHFIAEEEQQRVAIETNPNAEGKEVALLMQGYGIPRHATVPMLASLLPNPIQFLRFMMDIKHQMQKPSQNRPFVLAAVMFFGYLISGLLPLLPYFFTEDIIHALYVSIAISVVSMSAFGFLENYLTIGTKRSGAKGALQTVMVGITSGAAYGAGKLINLTVHA